MQVDAAAPITEHLALRPFDPPANPNQEETSADAAAEKATAQAAPYGIVIEDGLPAGPGQVNRTDFIEKLYPLIESTADELLVPAGRTARDCPYIEFWLNFYRRQSAAHIERAIEHYVQPAQHTPEGIGEAILAQVRRAVQAWVERREVQLPKEIDWRVDDDRIQSTRGSAPAAQLMGAGGEGAAAPPGSVASIRGRLSEGRPLEPAVRTRMEHGFGTNFRDVRVHDDARAASVARDYRARAFTVGQDIGFAAGQYRPGTIAGDLLLAHEIAHTIQQRSAAVEGPAQDLEADATLSAIGAVMPESELDAKPALRGGLALRRCGTGEEPAPQGVSDTEYNQTVTELRQLYARKTAIENGKAPASEGADVDRRIDELSKKVESWGVQLSARQLRRAVEANEDLRKKIGEPLELGPDDMADRGFRLVPPGGEPTVGRSYELSVRGPLRTYSMGGESGQSDVYAGSWYVKRPGEPKLHGQAGWTGSSHSWTLDKAGDWEFAVEIRLADGTGVLTQSISVVDPAKVAEEGINKIEPVNLAGFLSQLEYRNLINTHLGVLDQQFGVGTAYISQDGPNPANYLNTSTLSIPEHTYTVHPPTGVTPARYQWVAVPDNLSEYPTQSYFGKNRGVFAGKEGFNLGTGATATWLPINQGVVDIYCAMYDSAGAVVAEARYRQVMLRSEEEERVKKYQSYMQDARDALKEIRETSAVFVPAFYVATKTGEATELSFFVGQEVNGNDIKIVDVTPAVPRRQYGGSDFNGAINDFSKGNSYPDGTIRMRVPQNSLGITAQDWTVTTSGQSVSQRLSTVAGWESLGLAGLGALAAIVPGAEEFAPAFFFAAGSVGAVSAGAALYQQSQEVHPSGLEFAINIASLAGSLLGMAGAANILRYGPRVAALTKIGRFVLYAGYVTDTVGGVLILAQGAEQIAAILDGPGSADDKSAAITRILAGLLLNGAMLAWGARDINATRERVTGLVGADVMAHLSKGEIHMLSALEGPAMARLAGAPLEEVQSVAALIREDPVRASGLVQQYGEQFVTGARAGPENLEELAQALHAGAPEAAGTRGAYGPQPPQVAGAPRPLRPAYLEVRGQSSPLGLSDRVLQVFTRPGSPEGIVLAEGATLRNVTPASATPGQKIPQTQFELIIPASGSRPQQVIPVSIESTATRPVSVHGDETGPARMEIRSTVSASGTTQYSAKIEVHQDLAKTDVGFAVGHELDELALIANSGVRGADITAQKRASLARAQQGGGPAPPTTAHDTADFRGFANFVQKRVPQGGRGAHFELPEDVVTRALSLGFGGTAYLEEKLALLRQAGVDEDMISRLRTFAVRSELVGVPVLPANSPLATTRVIGHLLHPEPGSTASPLGGLHLDSALLEHQRNLVNSNAPTHLLRTADSPRTVGGITYNAYEQWVWTAGGTPGARPATPGGASGATFGGWRLASDPKTTFNDLGAFMTEAQGAWDTWRKANPTAAGNNVRWSAAGPGGQMIEGFVDLSSTPIDVRTVYPLRTGGLASW
jgi:hypothetical protein